MDKQVIEKLWGGDGIAREGVDDLSTSSTTLISDWKNVPDDCTCDAVLVTTSSIKQKKARQSLLRRCAGDSAVNKTEKAKAGHAHSAVASMTNLHVAPQTSADLCYHHGD